MHFPVAICFSSPFIKFYPRLPITAKKPDRNVDLCGDGKDDKRDHKQSMTTILGIIIVLGSCATGFILSHGNLLALWQPNELIIIAGSSLGAFIISNPLKTTITVFKSIPQLLSPPKYSRESYLNVLSLLYDLFVKARVKGMMALEQDVDEPENSEIFTNFPKILKDKHIVHFITDYLRLMVSGNMNAMEMESLMDLELETHHEEATIPANSLTKVSDALPGFGIVAAVMGVVITMGSLGGPVTEIGAHVAAALVGTFLGILLAYGFVGPMATYLEHKCREEAKYLECVKTTMVATLNGYSPQIAVEFGRKVIYAAERPGFVELEERIKKK